MADHSAAPSASAASGLPKIRRRGKQSAAPSAAEFAAAAGSSSSNHAPNATANDDDEVILVPTPPPKKTPDHVGQGIDASTSTPSFTDLKFCCFDCEAVEGGGKSAWLSATYGITLCLECAGVHRSLGVHVSFVRSLSLDTLTEREEASLRLGGNPAFASFLADDARGVPRKVWLALPLTTRYFTPAADLYKRRLGALLDKEEAALSARALPSDFDATIKPPPPPPSSGKKAGAAAGGGGGPGSPSGADADGDEMGIAALLPKWTRDRDAPRCQLCKADFWLFNTRHHCRKCGRCVCADCSPTESWKPLSDLLGGAANEDKTKPVRCCKLCVTPTRTMEGIS